MHWKRCECCGEPMIGIRDCPTPVRRECDPCGGHALGEGNYNQRMAAREWLRRFYSLHPLARQCVA